MGTAKNEGLRWANPFYSKRTISVRIRNFETGKLKVNDNRGNPVDLAAVVVWRVVDTAEALFNVNDYEDFVHVQSEAALRNMATGYPYDAHVSGEKSLSSHTAEIASAMLQRQRASAVVAARQKIVEGAVGMVTNLLGSLYT